MTSPPSKPYVTSLGYAHDGRCEIAQLRQHVVHFVRDGSRMRALDSSYRGPYGGDTPAERVRAVDVQTFAILG